MLDCNDALDSLLGVIACASVNRLRDNKMSKLITWLLASVGVIATGLLVSLLWDSSIFAAWHDSTANPVSRVLNWTARDIQVRRGVFLALVCWSLVSLIYIWIDARRIKIHSASYDSKNKRADVTELVRKRVEQHGLRRIPAANDFLGGDPDPGTGKILMVAYSIYGRKKEKTAAETEFLNLN
jgi:hypothetical protein